MDNEDSLIPQFVTSVASGWSFKSILNDLLAGVIVGIVALPLAIAFAIASGVKPEQGLYTAIIGGFIISVLGGSKFQIGGPTGAFTVIVYGVITRYGFEGLMVATAMAGLLLIVMAFLRVGSYIKLIPYPVIVGFTAGIAVIIFVGEIRNFMGFDIDHLPAECLDKCVAYAQNLSTINPWSVAVGSF